MASASAAIEQRNQEASLWVGGPLDERVDEDLLWELFVQAGPLASVHIPVDKVTGRHQGYGFVEFKSESDAEYALRVLNLVPLFGRPIKVRHASSDKGGRNAREVGANLFIGGLDVTVDESSLQATFGAFGMIIDAKVMRDPDTGVSKGFGFVSFDTFEASDAAIEAMNGQHFGGRPIVVQYAFKRDSKHERHGCPAERMLAQSRLETSTTTQFKPHTMFASAPGVVASATPSSSVPLIGQVQQAPLLLPPTAIAPAGTQAYNYQQPQAPMQSHMYPGMQALMPQSFAPPPMPATMAMMGAPRPPPLPTQPVMPGSMPMPPPMPGMMPGGMPMPPPMPGMVPGGMQMPPPMPGMMPGMMPGGMPYPMHQ